MSEQQTVRLCETSSVLPGWDQNFPREGSQISLKTDLTAVGAVILLVLKTNGGWILKVNGQISPQSPLLLSTKQAKIGCLCFLYIPTNGSMMLCWALRSVCELHGYLFVLYCTKKSLFSLKLLKELWLNRAFLVCFLFVLPYHLPLNTLMLTWISVTAVVARYETCWSLCSSIKGDITCNKGK